MLLIPIGHAASTLPFAAIGRDSPTVHEAPHILAFGRKRAATGQSDFVIQGPEDTGHSGYIALYGIESPGLTASLAIGEHVVELAGVA